MTKYDYREAVRRDVAEYFEEYIYFTPEDEQTADDFELECFMSDSVTGNRSGSYTMNRWTAEENLNGNMKLAIEAFREMEDGERFSEMLYEEDYERIDVTIRCYLVAEAVNELMAEVFA